MNASWGVIVHRIAAIPLEASTAVALKVLKKMVIHVFVSRLLFKLLFTLNKEM